MSEQTGRSSPSLKMRRAALERGDPNSQEKNFHTENFKSDVLEFQALTLRRLYFFAYDTARVVAHLAFGVAR